MPPAAGKPMLPLEQPMQMSRRRQRVQASSAALTAAARGPSPPCQPAAAAFRKAPILWAEQRLALSVGGPAGWGQLEWWADSAVLRWLLNDRLGLSLWFLF